MTFQEFMSGFKTAPPDSICMDSKPVDVLLYIRAQGYLKADIDFLDDYIQKHTPSHPDEWAEDEDCIGEIEDWRDMAVMLLERRAQEELESFIAMAEFGGFRETLINIAKNAKDD